MILPGGFELWGYPGAGKSTQARLLQHRRDVDLVPLPSLARSLALRPRTGLQSVWREDLWAAFVPRFAGRNPETLIARTAVRQRVALTGAASSLVEEGVLHEIWRALLNHTDYQRTGAWQGFLRLGGPNVIVLDVTPVEALRRIRTKHEMGPVNRQLASANDHMWRRAVDAYQSLLDAIRGNQALAVSVINVDDLAPEMVSERIAAIVQSRVAREPHSNGS
jgi:hypothetical protein